MIPLEDPMESIETIVIVVAWLVPFEMYRLHLLQLHSLHSHVCWYVNCHEQQVQGCWDCFDPNRGR